MNDITIYHPWDMAGVDGLVAARALFGESVDYLAPFQSMETVLGGEACSVLRLCDRNFRITYPGPLDQILSELKLQLWVKQLEWMRAVVLPVDCLPAIAAQATTKAPHRLQPLPLHCAAPAQINPIPALLWHHPIDNWPTLEVHLAYRQIAEFWDRIQSPTYSSVSLTTAHT
ncbi:hypothetical protein [Nodosilinea nodulosa]|uniref:hypothetical protein n=1 Tax=Nodosilinea nodulosa TaxID=416001 RepID=UPI00030D7CFE|nr:hypothetical protein [Nodosilinea nodulosa]